MTHICECSPNSEGRPTADYHLTCQGKVNARKMTLKEDNEVCTCKKRYVSISDDEKARLESVWKESDNSFKWVWNEEDECYYTEFAE